MALPETLQLYNQKKLDSTMESYASGSLEQWDMESLSYYPVSYTHLIQALDKIRTCMNLLIDAGYMKWQGSLRATYNKYLHPEDVYKRQVYSLCFSI